MRLLIFACLLALIPSIVCAQSTIDKLQPVPTFPLPDPASVPSNLWITQGGGDYKISPFKAGAPFQGPAAPANPFLGQLWFNTSSTPAQLVSWNGTNWIPFSSGFLNVTGFGVLGNGTDVSAALQAVLNNTSLQGCLYFPLATPGYALGSAVTVPTGTCFVGDPGDSRIYALPSNNTGLIKLAANAAIQMSSIFLDGNRTAGATGDCLSTDPVTGPRQMALDSVTINNCSGNGILLSGSTTPSRNVQVYNSIIRFNGTGIAAQYLKDFNINTNRIETNDGNGFICQVLDAGSCLTGTLSGNVFDANGCVTASDSISGHSEQNADIVITTNVVRNGCREGIQFGGSRVTIIGNHLIANQQNGIFVQSVRGYATGTINVSNGSTAVTGIATSWAGLCPDIQKGFIADTGTRLQTSTPPGNANTGGGSTTGVQIKSIDSNTALTLSDAWTGSTLLNATYRIRCPVPVISPVITGNTIQGIPSGWSGIFLAKPSGGTITGNSVDDAGGLHGVLVTGDQNGVTISANTVASKTNSGIRIDSDSRYSVGTVTATNGSPTVTMTGGTFDEIPGVTWFRAGTDPAAYQVDAQTSTTLTLHSNYTGTTGAGKTYIAQSSISQGTNVSGNVSRLNDVGVNLAGCWGCAVSGGANNGNITASVLEAGASSHNIMTGFSGATVTIIDANTQWLATGNQSSIKLGNLPTSGTAGTTLCVEASGRLYTKATCP